MKSLLRDEGGASAVIVALMLTSLVATAGLAIDGGRLFIVQSRLKAAVDAAVLVAARDMYPLTTANTATDVQDSTNLFWANFAQSNVTSTIGYLGTNISLVAVSPVGANVMQVTATGTLPTTFMSVVGIPTISVSATSQATRAATGLEIALVLDNTGSMAGWPIQSVVASASDLVNILYSNGTQDTEPNLWVSVVPFTAEVNIGSNNTNMINPANTSVPGAYMNKTWKGCVMARYDTVDPVTGLTNDFTDVTPNVAPFTPFLWPSTSYPTIRYPVTKTVLKVTTTYSIGDNDWSPNNITEVNQSTLQNAAVGPNLGCSQDTKGNGLPVQPLVASRTTVLATINQMVANFRGGTFINLGLQAGWWTLSPNWRGANGWRDSVLPLNYNTPYMQKIIVLMTDGNNQWYDYPNAAPGVGPTNLPDGTSTHWVNDGNTDFTAYGRLLDNHMRLPAGHNTQANATVNINNNMSQMCTIIKSKGIIIYTILFNHDGSVTSGTQTLFQNCASSPQNYFLDATDADLQATFSAIGQQLAALRLTQ